MSDGSVERGIKRSEDSLATHQLTVQFKRYYIDINENARGRYIKIAELGANYKSRIILSIPAAKAVVSEVTEMLKLISNPSSSATIKSETLTVDGRKFYIDLKENDRGRFLRIAQMPTNPRQHRQQIAVPSSGIAEVHSVLTDYLNEFGSKGLMETYTSATFIPKAKYYFSLSPPDIVQTSEKLWLAIAYSIKELFLTAGEIDLRSHKSLGYFCSFAIDSSELPFPERETLRNVWRSAEKLHQDSYGACNFRTSDYPRVIEDVERFVENFKSMDRTRLFAEFLSVFIDADATPKDVEVRRISGWIELGGNIFHHKFVAVV